jgi:hypothetical protein
MTRRVPRIAFAVTALLLLSACGPEKRVTLGVRDVATDILLSGASPPAAPPTPTTPLPTPPGFPFVPTPVTTTPNGGVFVPLPPKPSASPAPPPVSCPTAPDFVAPRYEAGVRPSGPPVEATYNVRTSGDYNIKGTTGTATGVYPAAGRRTIKDVSPLSNDAGWNYTVEDESGLSTSYQVLPKQLANDSTPVASDNQPVPTQAGIYISKFTYKRTDGSVLSLDPEPSLLVAKLPFARNDRWTSRGVDSATGITIVVNGQTGIGAEYSPSRAQVDACGTLLDGWWVEYTIDTTPLAEQVGNSEPPSQIQGPDILVKFAGSRVVFAPQFGGIPIEEIHHLEGTDKSDNLTIDRRAVYLREPALPAAP